MNIAFMQLEEINPYICVMTEHNIKSEIQETKVFQKMEKFKQNITLSSKNCKRLFELYGFAKRNGIGYLRQNPKLMNSDVNLIEELVNKQ